MFFPQQEYKQPFTPIRGDEGLHNQQNIGAALEFTPVRLQTTTQIGNDLASS